MKKIIITLFLAAALSAPVSAAGKVPVVSEKTLLKEMLDKSELAKLPCPSFDALQFSSYDRASVRPDDPSWYGNADFSQFLGVDEYADRKEYIMFDQDGPGAIVRFWMTLGLGENGTLRFYIDGAETPVIEATAMDVLSGSAVSSAPMAESVSHDSDYLVRGHNLYYPIPFAKHCKITYQRSLPSRESIYYSIACRKYTEPCQVISYTGKKDKELSELEAKTNAGLVAEAAPAKKSKILQAESTLAPGEETSFEISGERAINFMSFKLEAGDYNQALRSTVISIEFDGQRTVWAPVGDFCGVGYSDVYHKTLFNAAEPGKGLNTSWVMPFRTACRVIVHNYGTQDVKFSGKVAHTPWKWDERSMYFGASWFQLYDHKTGICNRATPQDCNFITLEGQGKYVGDNVTIFNTTGSWWGEGDEKIYIDGAEFPNHFGTGSEDYYGYAWCRPQVFTGHPFIGMPIGEGNLGIGRTVNNRYRVLDAITFNKSLNVNLEIFEWDENRLNYAPAAFWYMRPGGVSDKTPDIKGVSEKVIMTREQLLKPVLSFYIEGEDMTVEKLTGGESYIQYKGNVGWHYALCRFFHKASKGDKMILSFDSIVEAEVNADAIFTVANDYSVVNLWFNGQKVISDVDLRYNVITSKLVPMGTLQLKKGKNIVELEIAGEGSSPEKGIAGIDRLCFYLK